MIVASAGSRRSAGSSLGTNGGSSRLLLGMKERSSRTMASVSASFSPSKCATPLLVACVSAPPSSSFVTSSCVTVLMTSGPVMNMYPLPLDMKMKSVMAGGEKRRAAAARAHDDGDLRDDARAHDVALEDVGVAREADHTLLDARAARVVEPDDRSPDLQRQVHDLHDLLGERALEAGAEDGEVP